MCVRVFGLILCGDRPAQKNAAQGSDSKVEAIPDKVNTELIRLL